MTIPGNGWTEDRKLVEWRIGELEKRVDEGFKALSVQVATLRDENLKSQTIRRVMFLAAGALGGLISWLTPVLIAWAVHR